MYLLGACGISMHAAGLTLVKRDGRCWRHFLKPTTDSPMRMRCILVQYQELVVQDIFLRGEGILVRGSGFTIPQRTSRANRSALSFISSTIEACHGHDSDGVPNAGASIPRDSPFRRHGVHPDGHHSHRLNS